MLAGLAPAPVYSNTVETNDSLKSQPGRLVSRWSRNPHKRSCMICRQRKVRCDKVQPCAECKRRGHECIFPMPPKATGKKIRPSTDPEILRRLNRLESIVKDIGPPPDEALRSDSSTVSLLPNSQHRSQERRDSPLGDTVNLSCESSSPDTRPGRLVSNEGRCRYVSSQLWPGMGDDFAEVQAAFEDLSSDSENDDNDLFSTSLPTTTSESFSPENDQGFIFGYPSSAIDLEKLRPSTGQIFPLWESFQDNVDPMLKMLHRPTARNMFIQAASDYSQVSKATEALLFACYFAAVVSIDREICRSLLEDDKDALIRRFRVGTERAIARAGFLTSNNLTTLQAFTLYVMCLRNQEEISLVSSLLSLAIHLAQGLGLHRDGTNFDLDPFETEIRRRLWWTIFSQAIRSSEENCVESVPFTLYADTKLPLNINDDDISPQTKTWPKPHEGYTEMTSCLIRYELFETLLQIHRLNSKEHDQSGRTELLAKKERLIDECSKRIERKYLRHCDLTMPIIWLGTSVYRVILAKMWILAHQSYSSSEHQSFISVATRDKLFISCIEVIELWYFVGRYERTAKWRWLLQTYIQWHALIFILTQLCIRPASDPNFRRGWRAVDSIHVELSMGSSNRQRGMLRKHVRALLAKAKVHRAQQTGEEISMPSAGQDARGSYIHQDRRMSATAVETSKTTMQSAAEALGFVFDSECAPFSHVAMDADPNTAALLSASMSQTDCPYLDMSAYPMNDQVIQQNAELLTWPGWNLC